MGRNCSIFTRIKKMKTKRKTEQVIEGLCDISFGGQYISTERR